MPDFCQHIPKNPNYTANPDDFCNKLRPESKAYPLLLKSIHDPPKTLYYRGTLHAGLFPIAIIGSRKMSEYGQRSLRMIIAGLSGLPIAIISGLAYGTDAFAHELALEFKITTWAVLGSGIDDQSIYPQRHRRLAKRIIEAGGAVISESPCGTRPQQWSFPRRNRIIAGLSRAVLVSEAARGSGALITADCALSEGRDVFAVPGSIFAPNSAGTNTLIAHGAAPVTTAEDLLLQYNVFSSLAKPRPEKPGMSEQYTRLLAAVAEKPMSASEIIRATGLPAAEVTAALTELEINGIIMAFPPDLYGTVAGPISGSA